MNINNIIYLAKLMDEDTQEVLHKPMEQGYFKLHKPKLTLVVDNTKKKNLLKELVMTLILIRT